MRDPNYTWAIKNLMKEKNKIKVGVIGASGFTGEVLTDLLFNHSQVETIALSSRQLEGRNVTDVFKHLSIKSDIKFTSPEDDIFNECHAVFLCTPHGNSMNISKNFLKKKIKVIDLSADFRLKEAEVWNKWYDTQHSNPELLSESVYGLPELYKEDIKVANLVAVPGCYPTVSLISILPSLKLEQKIKSITIDAKSGMSGAGRSSVDNHLEKEMLNNFRLYGEKGHRHYPEIKQVVDSLSDEKIEVIPLIQGTTGLGGKKISYPRWKQAELRFFKVIIPVGVKTPIHTHPAPMVVYLAEGKLKHTRGDVITFHQSNH